MIQMLYTGASALLSQQRNIDVIANNVANLETDGYKKTRLDFEELLYKQMKAPYPASNGTEKNLMRGNGIRASQMIRLFMQGALQDTGRSLDFALEGPGFFAVENSAEQDEDSDIDETVLFVRGGNFNLSVEEEGTFLVDSQSRYVLSAEGARIQLPPGTDMSEVSCDPEGLLFLSGAEGGIQEIAKLQLVNFTNPGGLKDLGNGAYIQTETTGEILESDATVRQGAIESSNVDYAEEVTRLIRSQRAYQLASRVISTADQMMGLANTIRR
jgi:flagellar basal-body rod protein FlgG